MKKNYSSKRVIIRIFSAMVAVSLVCLLICGAYAIYSSQQELVFCNEAAMDIYFSGMLYTLQDLEQFCDNLYNKDSGFRALTLNSDVLTEEQSLMAWNNIRLMVRSRVTSNTGILVFDDRTERRFYAFGDQFFGGILRKETISMVDGVCNLCRTEPNLEMQRWCAFALEEEKESAIFMQARRYRNVYICAMVNISAYSGSFESHERSPITYSFLTNDRILTNRDYAAKHDITLEKMLEANDNQLHVSGLDYILQTRFDEHTGLGLCGMISTNSMWGNWWIFLALLVAGLIVVCVSFLGIYISVEKILLYPLQNIREASEQISQGSATFHKTPENSIEFAQIQDALETLVNQKVKLETEKMREESEKEHAMLQYYQLQTRSHFLLNCLKCLYNLTIRGDQETTLRVISCFSNHMRYIFHDSLTFVTVREELAEVEDYFQIINLERGDHILLTKTVDPKLMDYPIPPLLIQTFLENFQKHNPQSNILPHFTIRIDRVELADIPYVRIRLTDNGIGYSEEALKQLQNMDGVFVQFHVGIQNLCRRIEILYQKQHKTAFYNLPNGGACSVFYLPDSFGKQHGNYRSEANHKPKEGQIE